jgi:hypothetical protein
MSINKTEKPQKRYNHWFWNSRLIGTVEGACVRISSYLWQKQYGGK